MKERKFRSKFDKVMYEKGITNEELAAKTGLAVGSIKNLRRTGVEHCRYRILRKLCEALEVKGYEL
jgi:DNA-binding Xre family transcriptional regulator